VGLRTDLVVVEASGSVRRLYECGGVADEQSVARGAGQHTDHCQPDISDALRSVPAESNTQHM